MKSHITTINLNPVNNMINCIKSRSLQLLFLIGFSLIPLAIWAQPAYPPPPGGWTYMYEGGAAFAGPDFAWPPGSFTSLDGTWAHGDVDKNSDNWDGSAPGGVLVPGGGFGGNAPGGAGTFTENGVTFLRMQDAGDPTSAIFTSSG